MLDPNEREKILQQKRDTAKRWREAHPEESKLRGKEGYKKNPESGIKRACEHKKKLRATPEGRAKLKAQTRSEYLRNKDKEAARQKANYADPKFVAKRNAYIRNKEQTDPHFKLKRRLSCRVKNALILHKGKKADKTTKLIGCSIPDLVEHLEKQFQPGMTWDNYGEWHIDHKKPCASFDLTRPEEQFKCFHFSNLQPLWASDNLSKGAKLDWKP